MALATESVGATHEGRCPVCRAKLVARGPAEVIIRNAILKAEPETGRVVAKCARCKTWVDVPLRYTE